MVRTLIGSLRALLKRRAKQAPARARPEPAHHVMIHITLDAQHAKPLRQALIRECAEQSWTMRQTPLSSGQRVRLSLHLPKAAVSQALRDVARLAPAAEVGTLLEMPDAPSTGWLELSQPDSTTRHGEVSASAGTAIEIDCVAQLLSEDHVLLGVSAHSQHELFEKMGMFFQQHHAIPAETVTKALLDREAMGSTGLGQGLAIPHGHLKDLPQAMAVYVSLREPLQFDAPDGVPVRDVVVLLVPDWADTLHLRLLASVAEYFCDHRFRQQLHLCQDAAAICKLFQQGPGVHAISAA